MKNSAISFVLLYVFSLSFLISCDKKTNSPTNIVSFDFIQKSETYFLQNDTANPACNLQIAFFFPDSTNNPSQLIRLQSLFVEKMFGEYLDKLSPEKATEAYTQQYLNQFKQFENKSLLDNNINNESYYEDETGYAYYTRLKNDVLFNQNNFISFTVENISYEGGAHSSKSIYGYVIDLLSGELLSEDDFAGDYYQQNISRLLTRKIAELNGVTNSEDLENIGYNTVDIVPNNNFTIDNKGITYYYNENEIAGTMIGLTRVFIPFEEISIYLKEDNSLTDLF